MTNRYSGNWEKLGISWRVNGHAVEFCKWSYEGKSKQGRMQYGWRTICEVCGQEYITSREHSKTCSATCRKRLSRSKKSPRA